MNKTALATSILAGLGTMSLITIISIISFIFWPLAIAAGVGFFVYQNMNSPSTPDYDDLH